MYKKIKASGRIFCVGDIHGEITKFNEKLISVNFDKKSDIMLSVGDLIDRGEDSLSCLELINEPWFHCVRGNHEQMAFDAINEESDERVMHWMQNGGDWYIKLLPEDMLYAKRLIKQIDSLPYVIEINVNGTIIVICHADYPCNTYEYGKPIHKEATIWNRQRYTDSRDNYTMEIKGADLFIFGHTPIRSAITYSNQMYIDTGAVFGKELSVIEIK